jgi:hypothetical protein
MTSILKVNQIQNTAGGVPTAGDLGLNVTGSVLQVVHNTQTGFGSSTTTLTYVDTGLSVSITPSSTSSKILVFVNTNVAANRHSGNVARYDIRLVNGDASVIGCDKRYIGTDYQTSGNLSLIDALQGYFSPASTTAQTFKVQARIAAGYSSQANNIVLAWYNNSIHTITAMEIAG